jgi:hypothetical protein
MKTNPSYFSDFGRQARPVDIMRAPGWDCICAAASWKGMAAKFGATAHLDRAVLSIFNCSPNKTAAAIGFLQRFHLYFDQQS